MVIVPSGGLYRYGESDEAAAWLETYVAIGGTLIVLAQFDSPDWEMLPGGQVRGLGYDQDILCKNASVRIVNSSPWIVGIGRDLPDIQVDGSFTAWPADATIVLMRTTGNFTVLTFVVEDLKSVVSELREHGIVFEEYSMPGLSTVDGIAEMDGGYAAWFKDTEGNIVNIAQM